MTGPVNPVVGQARVELIADGSRMPATVREELEDLSNDSKIDRELKDTGREWGETLGDGIGDGIHRQAPSILDRLSGALDGESIRPDITIEYDRDGNISRFWVKQVSSKLRKAVEDEASSGGGGGSGGVFNPVGRAISDAIGASFNVSGRSALIPLLAFLVGYIAELVFGAMQAISGLTATLFTIPAVITAIVAQVGIAYLAFKGLGTAIEGAFAAKNAQELNEAIKDLTPSAQAFVKTLLPFRDFFKELQKLAQEQFFQAFGNGMSVALKGLQKINKGAIGDVAAALGNIGRTIATSFNDPVFIRFVNQLLPATVQWLDQLSKSLDTLLIGFANIGTAATPFLSWLGTVVNEGLADFGRWLSDLSQDPEFLDWLERMKGALAGLWAVLKSAGALIFSLFNSLDKAGGTEVLFHIAEGLNLLAGVLSSEVGVKGLEGLIHAAQFLAEAFIGIIVIVLFLFASLESFFEWLTNEAFPAVGKFIMEEIPGFLEFVGAVFVDFFQWLIVDVIGGALAWLLRTLFDIGGAIVTAVADWGADIWGFFTVEVPNMIRNAVADFGTLLYDAGKNLIQGLINGIRDNFGPLGAAVAKGAEIIANKLASHSPIKEGPLSPEGGGDPFTAGVNIVKRLAQGMAQATPVANQAAVGVAASVAAPNSPSAPIAEGGSTATGDEGGVTVYVYLGTEQITEILDARVQRGLAGTARALTRRPRGV